MITFTIALAVLVSGYFIYGKYINKIFGIDTKKDTPAVLKADGVDYVPMPVWKVFMIQFLNIAGLGPIFGAIMGAKFGTASYLWIVLGTIFAGAVHDYFSGMISLRNGGDSLPQIIGFYLGKKAEKVMVFFIMILMVLVGATFVSQPADLLAMLTPESLDVYFWITVIFLYYLIATMFPIDKIIGNIYPIFAIALLFMAFGILIMLFVKQPALPEMWESFGTKYDSNPIFPMMFITIACGAISGFHATQSPLMARCIKNEKYGRPVFYGAMVAEGIVALAWAAAATVYFQDNGASEETGRIVMNISKEWLGVFGGILAMLGVIAAPITTGDTALRSARLILADFLHLEQKSLKNRFIACLPTFALSIVVLIMSLNFKDGFGIVWRYLGYCNQVLSVFTLLAITVFLIREKKNYFVTLIPAMFMTYITSTYICIAPEGLEMTPWIAYLIGGITTVVVMIQFFIWKKNNIPQIKN